MSASFPRSVLVWTHPEARRSITLFIVVTAIALWGSQRATHAQSGPSYGITELRTIGGTAGVALTLDVAE